jgi:hypothetical protein
MPRASFAKHFTGTGLEGSVEGKGAMPVVLESMTFGTARGKDDVDLADITDSMGLTAERSSAVAIGPLVGRVATCVLRRRPA